MSEIEDRTVQFNSGGEEFRFELKCKRGLELGPVTIDQWWMPITPLYGQRASDPWAHNRLEILRFYWATIRQQNAQGERSAQEQLILASLVPHVRSQGSRNVFNDAFLGRPLSRNARAEVDDLERLISQEPDKKCSPMAFHKKSWTLLGCPEFPPGSEQCYSELTRQLLDEPCNRLAAGQLEQGVAEAITTWKRITKRRDAVAEKRAALDVLSYESRASLHAAYSVVWGTLLGAMHKFGHLTPDALRFHRMWHTDRRDSNSGTSLFHGHVFGLHPAFGPFMLTETGRRLIGAWLAEPMSPAAYRKLLRGCLLSLFHFAESKGQQQLRRRQGTLRNKRSERARAAIKTDERNRSRGKKH